MAAQADQQDCHLMALAPELRNDIYGLAFAPPQRDQEEEVELMYASPPGNSLLLVNRQIYKEAKGFYRTSYQRYWTSTKFVITNPSSTLVHSHPLDRFSERDLRHIKHLSLLTTVGTLFHTAPTDALDDAFWMFCLHHGGEGVRLTKVRDEGNVWKAVHYEGLDDTLGVQDSLFQDQGLKGHIPDFELLYIGVKTEDESSGLLGFLELENDVLEEEVVGVCMEELAVLLDGYVTDDDDDDSGTDGGDNGKEEVLWEIEITGLEEDDIMD